jgi:hypothetical protein
MKSLFHLSTPERATLALLAVILIAIVPWQHGTSATVQAMAIPQIPLAPQAPGISNSGPQLCIIAVIYASPNSFYFQCSQPVIGTVIYSFGAFTDAASSASTNRMMAVVTMAFSLGKPVNVFYTTDNAFNPPGCIASTCRRLDGVYITP